MRAIDSGRRRAGHIGQEAGRLLFRKIIATGVS
jgi:hypothetical protein